MKHVRAALVDRACKAIDEQLSDVFFTRALAIRMDRRPRTVGTFAAQVRMFESVRAFLTSTTLFVLADLPFALLFLLVIVWISPWMALPVVVIGLLTLALGWVLQARLQQNGTLCRALPSSYPIVRELPTKVAETFYVVQDPALFNTSYSDALLVSRGSAGGCVTQGRAGSSAVRS